MLGAGETRKQLYTESLWNFYSMINTTLKLCMH